MAVFSDLNGLRDSRMEPIWDLQAVRHEGDWVVAIADREGNPLEKDFAVLVPVSYTHLRAHETSAHL
eukprot:13285172-Alexandrium_andersonii.AAC.1